MRPHKIPLRKCIACQEMKSKKEMIRVVSNKEGQVNLDLTGKAHGRGAYVCKSKCCFDKTKKTRALNRTFHRDIPEEVYRALEVAFDKVKEHE